MRKPSLLRVCDTLALARATFIFRASLVQTGQRTPAPAGKGIRLLRLLPLAGVGQGQGVFENKHNQIIQEQSA